MNNDDFIEEVLAHLKISPVFVRLMKKALQSYMQDTAAKEEYEIASEIRDLIKHLESSFKSE